MLKIKFFLFLFYNFSNFWCQFSNFNSFPRTSKQPLRSASSIPGLTLIIRLISVLNWTCTELANWNWAWQIQPQNTRKGKIKKFPPQIEILLRSTVLREKPPSLFNDDFGFRFVNLLLPFLFFSLEKKTFSPVPLLDAGAEQWRRR